MRRQFLGWDRPALISAAEILLTRAQGQRLDLSRCMIAFPGSRAGRRWLEILVERSEELELDLSPPRIVTLGQLPDLLFEHRREVASELLQTVTWANCLSELAGERRSALLPKVPGDSEFGVWINYAEIFLSLHRDLTGDKLLMSDVEATCRELDSSTEAERWNVLAQLQEEYRAALLRIDSEDPWLSRVEAAKAGNCQSDSEIYLVGAVEMGATLRDMLRQVADRVTALVFAPESRLSDFDTFGCLKTEAWKQGRIHIDDEVIHIRDQPEDQAAAAVQAVAALDGSRAARDIVIGNADDEIAPHLSRAFGDCELPLHDAAGVAMESTFVVRLIDAIADYLELPNFDRFAALIRHPDLEHCIAQDINDDGGESIRSNVTETWLAAIDKFAADHLPETLTDAPSGRHGARVSQLSSWVDTWLEPLAGEPRPFKSWAEPLRDVLMKIYDAGPISLDNPADREIVEIFDHVAARLRDLNSLRAESSAFVGPVDAIRWLSGSLAGTALPTRTESDSIELLGWLELALDDAPVAIVTGCNEGKVPHSIIADPFLPNSLRRHLGMSDNTSRYARDAYAMTCLTATRELKIILGKRTAHSDPLAPSRLLLARPSDELTARVEKLFSSVVDRVPRFGGNSPGALVLNFPVPVPPSRPPRKPLSAMSVTAFRDYLSCPFGFYLKHVVRLKTTSDSMREIDALGFGNLAHDVLEEFGKSSLKESRDGREIGAFLSKSLQSKARLKYGNNSRPAVHLQIEQLRLRLLAFAEWQANWARDGWRIVHSERIVDADDGAIIKTDIASMKLKGRIDRIDHNARTGQYVVFDYKTSEKVKTPDEAHRKKKSWIDLQLPLYRHLVRSLGIEEKPQLGYILLPGSASKVQHYVAGWSDEELSEADDRARWVVDQIHNGVFGPPTRTRPIPMFFQDFAAIYQDDILSAQIGIDSSASGDHSS